MAKLSKPENHSAYASHTDISVLKVLKYLKGGETCVSTFDMYELIYGEDDSDRPHKRHMIGRTIKFLKDNMLIQCLNYKRRTNRPGQLKKNKEKIYIITLAGEDYYRENYLKLHELQYNS